MHTGPAENGGPCRQCASSTLEWSCLARLPATAAAGPGVLESRGLQVKPAGTSGVPGRAAQATGCSRQGGVAARPTLQRVVLPHAAGILFRNQKAIGKLCSPRVTLTSVELEDAAASRDGAASTAVQECSLAFDAWEPAGGGGKGAGSGAAQQPLRIPVDAVFEQAELSVQVRPQEWALTPSRGRFLGGSPPVGRWLLHHARCQSSYARGGLLASEKQRPTHLQVIGWQNGGSAGSGSSFALPHRYSVHGKDLATQLQLELQRQSYVRKHQAARSAASAEQQQPQQREQPDSSLGPAAAPRPAAAAAGSSTVALESGEPNVPLLRGVWVWCTCASGSVLSIFACGPRLFLCWAYRRTAHSCPAAHRPHTGNEVERLVSVFEVGEKPAWLKSLVCKFLVAEAPASPAPAAASAARHANSPTQKGEDEASSGSGSGALLPQRKHQGPRKPPQQQPLQQQPRRKQADAGMSRPGAGAAEREREQQPQPQPEVLLGAGEGESTPKHAASPGVLPQLGAASPAGSPMRKKGKKKKAGKAREQPSELGKAAVEAQPAAGEAAAAAAPAMAQAAKLKAPARQPALREPPSLSGNRGVVPAVALSKQLSPPPGLHRHAAEGQVEEAEEQQQQRPWSANRQGRRSIDLLPGRADAPGRWRPLPPEPHKRGLQRAAPGSGNGSSSDVSSEAGPAALGRPSSVAGLSSCSSSPPAEPAELQAPAKAAAAAGAAPAPAAAARPHRAVAMGPAAVRMLAEALLPHEAPRRRLSAASSRQAAGAAEGSPAQHQAGQAAAEEASPAAPAQGTLPQPAEPARPEPACTDDVAGSEHGAATPRSSAPSTPRSRGATAGASSLAGYSSSSSTVSSCDQAASDTALGLPYSTSGVRDCWVPAAALPLLLCRCCPPACRVGLLC